MNDIKYVIINIICFFMLSFGFVMQGSFNRQPSHVSSSSLADQYCSKHCCRAQAAACTKKDEPGDFVRSLTTTPSGFMQRVIGSINGTTVTSQHSINMQLNAMNRKVQEFKKTLEIESGFDSEKALQDAYDIQKMQEDIIAVISIYETEKAGAGAGFSH